MKRNKVGQCLITLNADMAEQLTRTARREKVSKSQIVESALRHHFASEAPQNPIKSPLRSAVLSAYESRGWSLLEVSRRSGVPYTRLVDWLNWPNVSISSRHLERVLQSLDLQLVTVQPMQMSA